MTLRRILSKFLLLTVVLTLTGAGCGGPSQAESLASKGVTLTVWNVFDGSEAFQDIVDDYQALHPNVSFEFRQLRYDEYENELIQAFAEGRGPDIYAINNTWVGKYESLIQPMPDSVKIPFVEVRGTIKKEVIYTIQEKPTLSQRALKADYPDLIVEDVLRPHQETTRGEMKDRIYALPLALDTMALYYNKDLVRAAGFPEPPTTWKDFQTQVRKLSKTGPNNSIVQAGAGIGTSKNVERSTDLLALLMMQNGTQMVDERNFATFAAGEEEDIALTADAVRFYTDFANPLKDVYTWNDTQPNSFDAFTSGDSAFFFGYSYHAPLIKIAAPKLNYAVAPMPQIEGGKVVNFANYWLETVAKSTDNVDWAWDFLQFASSKEHVVDYLSASKKPTARLDLISTQIEDEDLSVFVSQVLTASSWYKGKKANVVEQALTELIDATLAGEDLNSALSLSQNKINQTF